MRIPVLMAVLFVGLLVGGIATAGPPGGGGFGQYTVPVVTSGGCPSGSTCAPVTQVVVSGNGFCQQGVGGSGCGFTQWQVTTPPGNTYIQTIVSDASTTAVIDPNGSGNFTPTPMRCGYSYMSGVGPLVGDPYIPLGSPIAYIPNSSDGTVSVYDASFFGATATIPVGVSPYGVAIDPRGLRVYISNRGDGTVSVIDPETISVVATIYTGQAPAGLATYQAGTRLLIALESENALSVVDTKSLQEIKRISLSNSPHDVVVSPVANVAYVLSRSAATISVVDLETLEETASIPLAVGDYNKPTVMLVSSDGHRIIISLVDVGQTSSLLAVIETATRNVDYVATFDQPIVDVTQNTDGTSLYLVPYTSTCTQILELNAATYVGIGMYQAQGGALVRGVYNGSGLFLISQSENTIYGLQNLPVTADDLISSPTGNQPMALGNFIAPARAPIATPDAATLDFGQAAINDSIVRALTVTNTGNASLWINQTAVEASAFTCAADPCDPGLDTAAFSIIEDNCAENTIAVDASCSVTIQYLPTANHLSSGILRLYTFGDRNNLDISLEGGVLPTSVSTPPIEESPATSAVTDNEGKSIKGGGGSFDLTDLLILTLAYFGFVLAERRKRLVAGAFVGASIKR